LLGLLEEFDLETVLDRGYGRGHPGQSPAHNRQSWGKFPT
jgi:hypothetical protein